MQKPYIDFHTHTLRSDGYYTPEELIKKALAAGIGCLAITDHNKNLDNLKELQIKNPRIRLIRGSEISCIYTLPTGREVEIHLVALGYDPNHPAMQKLFSQNNPDRRPYINQILGRLRACHIDLGSYEELHALYPETDYIGRKLLAMILRDRGFVRTIDEAFDTYIGAFGQRCAYVPNPLKYVSFKDAIAAILASGGIVVLAHLFYYQFTESETLIFLRHFKDLTGDMGAMETEYARYTPEQRAILWRLANTFQLYPSAGSDYHGQDPMESLANHFPYEIYELLSEKFAI